MKSYAHLILTSLGLAVLAGCDGATITIEPHSSMSAVSSSSVAESSSSSEVVSSSSSEQSSSSTSSVHICDSDMPPPGAPMCYRITPECPDTAVCAPEYIYGDFCSVRGLDAEIVELGDEHNCHQYVDVDHINCETLNGRTYYSQELGEMGLSPDGVWMGHWTASFENGDLRLMQSDVGVMGNYECRDGQVIATISKTEEILEFSEGFDSVILHPFGQEPIQYNYHGEVEPSGDCAWVAGNVYTTPLSDAASPLEGPTFLDFSGGSNTVTFGYGDIREAGHYVCTLGELQVHLSSRKEAMRLYVERHGIEVTILDENNITLPIDIPTPPPCDTAYTPVCATETVQCVTTPCPPLHKTYSNQCEAESRGETIISEGECGKLEGTPVESLPVACIALYDPICGKRKNNEIACITEPCPNYEYKTFGNSCEAAAQFAAVSFNGGCGQYGLEDTMSFHHQPVRLDIAEPKELTQVTLISANIEGDILTAHVGYSGCATQPINFTVSTAFLESFPVQAKSVFSKTVNDLCEAAFQSTVEYDLLPLKAAYQKMYNATDGQISLQGIGLYKF